MNIALICDFSNSSLGSRNYQLAFLQRLYKVQNSHINDDIHWLIYVLEDQNEKIVIDRDWKKIRKIRFLKRFFILLKKNIITYEILRLLNVHISFFEKKLIKDKIDLVYFMSPSILILDLFKLPYIQTVWDFGHIDLSGFKETWQEGKFERLDFFYSKSLKKAAHIVTESNATREKVRSHYGISGEKVTSLGTIFDVGSLLPIEDNIKDIFDEYFVYPASFWSHKNHIFLLKLLYGMKKNKEAFNLVFTGLDKGNLQEINLRIKELQLTNHVKIFINLSNDKLQKLIFFSKGVLFPSLLGPTNMPIIEAIALGVPVIASDIHSFDENLGPLYVQIPLVDSERWIKGIRALQQIKRRNNLMRNTLFDNNSHSMESLVEILRKQAVYLESLKP